MHLLIYLACALQQQLLRSAQFLCIHQILLVPGPEGVPGAV